MKKILTILVALILIVNGNAWGQTPHADAFLTYPIPEYSDLVLREGYTYISDCLPHLGVDYDIIPDIANSNTTNTFHVIAAADGIVSFVSAYHAQYGYYMTIDHTINGNAYQTLYAHMREPSPLPENTSVKRGQFIGWGGSTGLSTGVHLHLELKNGGIRKDPYQLNNTANGYICGTNPAEYSGIQYPELQGSSGTYWTMGNNHYWQTAVDGFPAYPNLIVPGFYEAGVNGWRLPNDAVDPGYSEYFLNAYNSWINHPLNPNHNSLGTPWDNGGGVYVHDVYGVLIQDFDGPNNGLAHPYTALVKDPNQNDGVYLLKEGFWDEYMNNAGWMQYGYPTNDENPAWVNPDDGLTYSRQDFSTLNGVDRYFLWRQGSDVIVKKTSDNTLLNLFNAIFQISGASKTLGDDGIYYGDHFVASFGTPIHLLEGQTYSGLYALIGGVQTPIDQFTVTGDMTIVVGGEGSVDLCEVGSVDTNVAEGIFVSGNYAYVADSSAGMKVIDVSIPSSPTIIGSMNTGTGYAYGIVISNNYAYVANHLGGVWIIDVSDPSNPVFTSSVYTLGNAFTIFLSGNYAYVANETQGMKVVDVSDPTNPVIVGSLDTWNPYKIFVSNNYAYVADREEGVKVVDVSDPTNPVIVGSLDTNGTTLTIFVSGNYAYVADGSAGLKVVDVSDPTNPVIVGSLDTNGLAKGILLSGNYAYVANYTEGVKVVDVSDPTNPVIVGSLDTEKAQETFVTGNYIYVADDVAGIKILQKSCGTTAAVSANFVGDPLTVYVGNNVNFSDYSTGYPTSWAWNFGDGSNSTVQNPTHVYSMHGTFDVSLTVDNGTSTDLKTITDMVVVQKQPPYEEPIYPQQSPNPFNPITVIKFKLDSPGQVKLEIFDLRGRKVASLLDQTMNQGVHQVRFDGRSLASGVYFYSLSSLSGTITRKMLLLK